MTTHQLKVIHVGLYWPTNCLKNNILNWVPTFENWSMSQKNWDFRFQQSQTTDLARLALFLRVEVCWNRGLGVLGWAAGSSDHQDLSRHFTFISLAFPGCRHLKSWPIWACLFKFLFPELGYKFLKARAFLLWLFSLLALPCIVLDT